MIRYLRSTAMYKTHPIPGSPDLQGAYGDIAGLFYIVYPRLR